MNAVAFSLYGANPKYTDGIIHNAWLMPKVYPGWEMHVWVELKTVPKNTTLTLYHMNAKIHFMDGRFRNRMFYRLLIHDEPGIERYLIRDADSRISLREARCVQEWIKAGTMLHTIHDHYYHQRPIQGGMFGIWASRVTWSMEKQFGSYATSEKWGLDEEFLCNCIWPFFIGSHTEHGHSKPIPYTNEDDPQSFIGEIFDEKGQPNAEHRAMRHDPTFSHLAPRTW